MNDQNDFREERRQRWEQRREERRERWEQYRMRHADGKSHIWTGVFILLIGVVGLIKVSVMDVPDWVFSWQMLLIALGVFIGLRHSFRGIAWFVLMMVGGVFLLNDIYPELTFRRYLWPVILIFIGAFFILRPRRRFTPDDGEKKNITGADPVIEPDTTYTKEDFVDSTSFFGGSKKNIISKNFKGGDLVNIFGGTELDLTQADISGNAVIELTTIFGGTKLIVPSNWSVKSEAVTIFGGMEDKRKMHPVPETPGKTLTLKGTVIFGGIEIKSY
jgi:predicted membrane protein